MSRRKEVSAPAFASGFPSSSIPREAKLERLSGFMLDPARCLESRAYYRRFIEFCAERGVETILWHFTDDQGCALRFDSMPEIASPNAYSKTEMRELVSFARNHGVTIIPELETLGHSRYITRLPQYRHLLESDGNFTALCPVAAETRKIVSGLLAEVAEVFDSPLIHVGLDEVNFGEHPLTRKALETQSGEEVFRDYACFIHSVVRDLGRRMIMWGDRGTVALAATLPKDVIIANWQYSASVSRQQIQDFLDLGLDVILCPALITYDQQFLSGNQLGVSNIRAMARHSSARGSGNVLGMITTLWTGTRYFHNAQWLGLNVACDLMKKGSEAGQAVSVRDFLQTFHGTTDAEMLEHALARTLEIAPLRAEYLAILGLADLDGLDPIVCQDRAAEWRALEAVLLQGKWLIRKNADAYDTFCLAVTLMAYLYLRASALVTPAGEASGSSARTLLPKGHALHQQLLQVWDKERFSDDPKKYEPAFDFDETESLIVMFRESLAILAQLLPQTVSAVAACYA